MSTSTSLERTRTAGDVVLGALLTIGGLVILGHVVLATAVSVTFLAWMLIVFGGLGVAGALFRIGKGGFWASALTGGLLLVLGLFMLDNIAAAAVTLTLVAGALFLTGGITRLVAASSHPDYRAALVLSGVVSVVLGLIVLLNLFEASFVLLGVLLGVEVLSDGISMMMFGRLRFPAMGTTPHVATR